MNRLYSCLFIVSVVFLTGSTKLTGEPPAPILIIDQIGDGYSSPAVTADRIFVTGEKDGTGYLSVFDFTGNLKWRSSYGSEWKENYPGSRAAPVCIDTMVYVTSGIGDLVCFDIRNGSVIWKVNLIKDLHGENPGFGYSLPVVIHDERLYCVPGGADTNVVCLNRFSGKLIWISDGNQEAAAYAPPLFLTLQKRTMLIVFSELAMAGIDADKGEKLWTQDLSFKAFAPCNQPVFYGGFLYIAEGPDNGAMKFALSDDGKELKKIWVNPDFCPYFGGFVRNGNYLFGSSEKKRRWFSLDTGTGKITDTLSFGNGATAAWDKGLVLYNQTGNVGIIELNDGRMTMKKSFAITHGTGEHFAHPVVAGEKLLIRHGDALLVYDQQQILYPNRE